jgi:hypothetical protein
MQHNCLKLQATTSVIAFLENLEIIEIPISTTSILIVTAQAHTMATVEKKKERPSALRSIIAGSTAGAVEIGMSSFDLIAWLIGLQWVLFNKFREYTANSVKL